MASTDIQNGTALPFEFLGFNLPSDLRVVVAKHNGAADRAIRVVLFNGELALATGGATYGHSTAKNAIGVAAVDVAEAAGGEFIPGLITPVELFSSDGWRQMFYKKDNTRIRGGVTFGSGGGEALQEARDLGVVERELVGQRERPHLQRVHAGVAQLAYRGRVDSRGDGWQPAMLVIVLASVVATAAVPAAFGSR